MDIKRTGVAARKRRRRLWIGTGVTAVAALLAVVLLGMEPPTPTVQESQIWIDQVQEGGMLRQVRGTGVLAPREVRWIAAQSPGRIERVLVARGTRHDRPGTDGND